MKVTSWSVRAWDRINDVIMVVAGILLWGQMLIVNIEVFSRYLGRPTTWVTEISSILVLWIPFMIAAWVLRKEGHVKMDLLIERFHPRTRGLVDCITSLIGVVVMLIVAWAGLMTTIYWIGNRTPTILMLPRSPIVGIIFFGSLLFAVQFFISALQNFRRWKGDKTLTNDSEESLTFDSTL
ncbi:MAG: TRAP transporter small permease [candidate division WOR-3 bacterium]